MGHEGPDRARRRGSSRNVGEQRLPGVGHGFRLSQRVHQRRQDHTEAVLQVGTERLGAAGDQRSRFAGHGAAVCKAEPEQCKQLAQVPHQKLAIVQLDGPPQTSQALDLDIRV